MTLTVRANEGGARTATVPKTVPGKVTVKRMVLDAFYADPKLELSTKGAVESIRAKNPGTNESSIRVWISDFQKDGSIKAGEARGSPGDPEGRQDRRSVL